MATDPVQQVRAQALDSPFAVHPATELERMAALPPSPEVPYLTVALDWRPEGGEPRRRVSRQELEQAIDALLGQHEAHAPAHESLRQDRDAVMAFIDTLDAATQGVFMVACSGHGVFAAVPLGLPLATSVRFEPVPALAPLARLVEDQPPYAVLLADQRQATLLLVSQATPARQLEVEGAEYPRHQQQGGWSQRRYQMRADERINAFARGVAAETEQALDAWGATMLILAAGEVIGSALDGEWSDRVRERIVGRVHLGMEAGTREILEATQPLVEEAARRREARAVERLREGIGADLAATGPDDVMLALQEGRVDTLLMVDDVAGSAWADYSFPVSGAGDPPGEHPAGGDPATIVPVPLEDELLRLAFATGAAVEIVRGTPPVAAPEGAVPDAGTAPPRMEPAAALDEHGGVAAILRYDFGAGIRTDAEGRAIEG